MMANSQQLEINSFIANVNLLARHLEAISELNARFTDEDIEALVKLSAFNLTPLIEDLEKGDLSALRIVSTNINSIIEILSKYEEFKEFHSVFKVIAANVVMLQKLVDNIDALLDIHSNLTALLSISAIHVVLLMSITLTRTIGDVTAVPKSQLSGTTLVANKSLFCDLSGTLSVYTGDSNATTANLRTITTSPTNVDNVPTASSENLVKSGGVYNAVYAKVDKVTLTNRIYGTDSSGNQTTFDQNTLGGSVVLTLNTTILTRNIGGVTNVGKANLNNPTATLLLNKSIITDSRGTLGVYTADINSTTITVTTKAISPTGSSSANFLGVIDTRAELPLTIADAVATFGRTPSIDNYCRILVDESNSGSSTEIYITDIVSNVISWGNDYVISDSNFQEPTTDLDEGLLLVGGPTAGTFGTSIDPAKFEVVANKSTIIDNTSTDDQYPTSKSVYDLSSDIHTVINTKANINSPALTGVPTAPTATSGTNTTQLATTAFVNNVKTDLNNSIASVSGTVISTVATHNTSATAHSDLFTAVDTSLSNAISNHNTLSSAHSAAMALKANLASPALTGTPTAPTASVGTNTTQIATTAWSNTAIGNAIDPINTSLDELIEKVSTIGTDVGRITYLSSNTTDGMYSDDNGKTWSTVTLPITGLWYTLLRLPSGKLVSVSNTLSVVIYSDDGGKTWLQGTSLPASGTNKQTIVTSTGRILVLQAANCFISDDEGSTWSTVTLPNSNAKSYSAIGISNTNRIFSFSSNTTATFIYSDDNGNSWTTGTLPNSLSFYGPLVTTSTGRLFIHGSNAIGLFSDNDGSTWTAVTTTITATPYSTIVLPNNRIFVFASSGNIAIYSDDYGVTWTSVTLPTNISVRGGTTVTSTGRVIVFTMAGNTYIYSDDYGETWTIATSPLSGSWYWAINSAPSKLDAAMISHNFDEEAHLYTNNALRVPTNHILTVVQDFNAYLTPGIWDFNAEGLHTNAPPAYTGTTVPAGILRVTVSGAPGILNNVFQEYMVWQTTTQHGVIWTRGYHGTTYGWSSWKRNSSPINLLSLITITTPVATSPYTMPYDGYILLSCSAGSTAASLVADEQAIFYTSSSVSIAIQYTSPLLIRGTLVYTTGTINWVHVHPAYGSA